MSAFELTFPGRPVPWARVARGKGGKGITPAKQLLHRRALAKAMQFAEGRHAFVGPVQLAVTFDYTRNETRIRIAGVGPPARYDKAYRKGVADADNCIKQVMEAAELAGIVADDVQFVSVTAEKVG